MLYLKNTLNRQREVFQPLEPGVVKLYTCGPTVYNHAHLGNFRAYIFEDILRRTLEYCGYRVIQVMNLTDIDDKTIRGAMTAGVDLAAFTQPYKDAFFEDLQVLRIARAEHYPEATGHIADMIVLIERLLDGGYAYVAADGSVYFRISSFPDYGRLARLDMAGLKPGARVTHDEYGKDNAADFALWKAWDAADGDVAWDSPWGRGRPGWHIECSAMSMRYLGETFDIHTGGIDNIFPHHEDEIAQSQAATGKPLARYWLHCAHLIVDGQKMSKSLGNFHTLRDVTAMGFRGREIRYLLASAHYRQSLNFTFETLRAIRTALERLDASIERLKSVAGSPHALEPAALPEWAQRIDSAFGEKISDDLNTPAAFGLLFDSVHECNRRMDDDALPGGEALAILDMLKRWDHVLAVMQPDDDAAAAPENIDPEIERLLSRRSEARSAKDFAASDRIRDELRERGWIVRDTRDGQKVKPADS